MTTSGDRWPCACCGYRTLTEGPSGRHELCPVCWWEDDGLPPWTSDGPGGGPLYVAQRHFLARERIPGWYAWRTVRSLRRPASVRPRRPRPDEAREPGWRPIEVTPELLRNAARQRLADEARWRRSAVQEQHDPQHGAALADWNRTLAALRRDARTLTLAEVQARVTALVPGGGARFMAAELELLARDLRDPHWRRDPRQVLAWLRRHGRTAPLRRRLRQLRRGPARFAG